MAGIRGHWKMSVGHDVTMATLLTALSWALLVCPVSSQTRVCDSGWFGSLCQYKCRCASGCDGDGQCTSGLCLGGWFGPACQYADMVNKTEPPITIGVNNLCSMSSRLGNTLKVELKSPAWFTWMRVRVSNSDFLHQLTVQFKDDASLACLNSRNASVDSTTLDIHCDPGELVQSVTLSGEGVQYLCSVYVSGGRNVALKQPTAQSTTYSYWFSGGFQKYCSSNQSVDGDTNGYLFTTNSCSLTETNKGIANWNVTFLQLPRIQRYAIYNRKDANTDRLIQFILQTFDQDGRMVFNYTYPNRLILDVYTVTMPVNVTSPVSLVNIISNNNEKVVQMCEVEVYGESVCEEGKFSPNCDRDCKCLEGGTCFSSTGGCPSGCEPGFYGVSCYLPCLPETYGLRCGRNCSKFCAMDVRKESSCDHVSGTCLYGCSNGYQGQQCTEICLPETYGPGCNNTCSEFCVKDTSDERSCEHVNGTCLRGCQSGFEGATCSSPCSLGRYGQDCNSTCSHFCIATNKTDGSPCHHITGICLFGCNGSHDSLFCKQGQQGSHENNEDSVIIGAVVGSVLGAVFVSLVILAVVVLTRRYKKAKSETGHFSHTDKSMSGGDANLSGSAISLPSAVNNAKHKPTATEVNSAIEGGKETNNSASPMIYYNTLFAQGSTIVSLEKLEEFMDSKDKDFFNNQFSAISANQNATMNVGLSDENKHKNRYKNICAYDHSRVHLIPNVTRKHGDYINASYLEGYKSDETFIASQGPTRTMLEDFVRMLWEQKVEKVVMLTNLVEDGKQKCEKYWPDDGEMKVGDISVKLGTTQMFADYTIRRLQLRKQGQPGQDMIHFHFTSWPDKDIPNTSWGLVDFEQRVASYLTSKPIVVHCSAGVGRTGTFIALRNVMRQAEETGHMDFFTTVQKLRQDRVNMVQTVDQYIFLHRAAQVAMLYIGTSVTSTDVQKRISELETKMASGQTKMEKEFKSICSACDTKEEQWTLEKNQDSVYEISECIVNRQKNRDNTPLPKDIYRAKLLDEVSDLDNYINAVLVPSFSKQNQQVLTQLPLPATVTNFWRLVTQYQVNLIVAFDVDLGTTDPTIADYLSPSDETSSSLFKIKTEPASSAMYWRQQRLVITMETATAKLVNITSTEHHVTNLTNTSSDLNKDTQLALVQHIRSLQREAGDGRTLYMCRDGATYSGLVCVLSLLLDRMDNDQCLSIPLVVGSIKAVRPEIIPTLDQYRLLYDVLDLYSETMNEYSNFGSTKS